MQAIWCYINLATFGVERAAEHHFTGVLRNFEKSAGANEIAIEMGDVDVTVLIHLSHAEEGDIDPSATVEFELIE